MNRLTCPRCQAAYPRWRVPVGQGVFGGSGQLAAFRSAAALGGLVLGFDQIWTWRFMLTFLAFAVLLGYAAKVLVGGLELQDGHG